MLPAPAVDRNTHVVGARPRLTLAQFTSVLEAASSPALIEAETSYKAIVTAGVDPAFCLAIFAVESAFGTAGLAVANKSPGNTRSTITGKGMVVETTKGKFVRYPNWTEGFRDLAVRLIEPDYVYARNGYRTIGQIIPVFAPTSDGNSPEIYTTNVVKLMNVWIQSGREEVPTKMKLKIALSAGHHNTDGGSQVEYAITGPLCREYARAFRAAGADVRVITPDDGLGQYPGGLDDVAAKVVEWSRSGWTADLFLETHTEGVGDTSVRGVFAIYPDWGSDLDLVVKNQLGNRVARAISQVSGIPVRGTGLMSEKNTGVGLDGYRLGIFRVTAPVAAKTTRLIVEHGAHSSPADLAILRSPGMFDRIASAAVKAITTYYGDDMSNQKPSAEVIKMNGHNLGHGMLDYWNRVNIPGVQHPLGLPLSEEQDWTSPDGKKLVIQVFERGALGYDSTIADPAFRVQGLLIGYEWGKEKGLVG